MNSTTFPPIPLETARAAETIYGRNNHYLVIGDRVNELFTGLTLDSPLGSFQKPSHKLAILYLITIFQHLETLPDQLAVNALRERADWKYAFHAPLNPPPFEVSTLCEFRKIIIADPSSKNTLQRLLERLAVTPQIALRESLNQDAGRVISHVCRISRLWDIWEAFNQALEAVATKQPQWLRCNSLPHWYERYGHVRKTLNLRADRQEQEALAQAIGADGLYLLAAISDSKTHELGELPEITALQKNWEEQFERELGSVVWRIEACAGCSFSTREHITTWEVSRAQKERPVM
jgi:hypothetical protein